MFDFIKLSISFLHLCVLDVVWDGDSLIVSGRDWRFVTSSAWRVSRNNDLLFACWDDDADKLIGGFLGLSIVGLSWINDKQPIDPSILFSDGRRLDVFCASSIEPWVLNLPDGNIYIGNS
ncbi:hypothetical protein ACFW0H_07685 [Pseudomonas sp. CR3202]|uniref:hypothetical protein n=1 Tax=Pseudomonas sp. CR3202 TaxID=3351532 RepID=UPI003BF114A3